MKFRNFLEGQELIESAGNLKGLPNKFIKKLVTNHNSLAGKGSTLQLFKKNAKQKDVTSAAKKCGGWVKPSERGYRSYSKAELQAQADKENYAGVVIKVDGEWAFMAEYDEFGHNGGHYKITVSDGSMATVKRRDSRIIGRGARRRKLYDEFDSEYLKATEISGIIDFEQEVDVYIVTTDADRILKRQEREADKVVPKVSSAKKKAIVKFLENKSNGIIAKSDARLQELTQKISKQVSSILTNAIQGKVKEINTQALLDSLNKEISSANSLASYISGMVKTGNIKDKSWNGTADDTWAYKKFKELSKEMQDQEL